MCSGRNSYGSGVIAVGGDNYSPNHYVVDGEPVDFDVDLIQAVARTISLDLEARPTPRQEARDRLDDSTVQMHIGVTISRERMR